MIVFLRSISTRRLLGLCAVVVGLVGGGTALAIAATGSGPTPPPKPLDVAVHDALTAPQAQGVSGRIQFTNHLVNGSDVRGGSPLLNGASGRFWAANDGRLRLELQADAGGDGGTGDAQILSDGRRISVYDSGSNTVYEATLPKARDQQASDSTGTEQPPSLARVRKGLARLMDHTNVSGADPTDVAGQPAYSVRVEPKANGGLLGGAELAWDSVHGVPLRAALYAKGDSSPVVELRATDISYGPVDSSVFDITPPSDAQVVDLSPSGARSGSPSETSPVTGLDQVQQQVEFPLSAPDTLAGRKRNEVRLLQSDKHPGALATYGKGLDGIAVLERAVDSSQSSGGHAGGEGQVSLPTVSIDGTQGEELETPLGTMVRFQRAGVEYTVLGSVSGATALAAARDLQ